MNRAAPLQAASLQFVRAVLEPYIEFFRFIPPIAFITLFLIWAAVGLVVYFLYSRSRSYVGRGIIDVHEDDPDAPPQPVPPAPSFKD